MSILTKAARLAMATRFEIVIHGDDPVHDRAVAEEALAEIERLEGELSLFNPSSSVSRINARAAAEPVRVESSLFTLLLRARQIFLETKGAFDISISPLMSCWGFRGGIPRKPTPGQIATALAQSGMQHLELDESNRTVRFTKPGLRIDLGAIGKGWAIEKAVEILDESEARSALIHGGTSSVHAIGSPPGQTSWKVALPKDSATVIPSTEASMEIIELVDSSLSVSAVWGRTFKDSQTGEVFGHIIDPRSGLPVGHTLMSAVVCRSATEADALSTALMVMGEPGLDVVSAMRPEASLFLLDQSGGEVRALNRNWRFST